MLSIRAFRNIPHFAASFAQVHVLFWPILWWSLNRLLRLYEDGRFEEILYTVSPWGYVRVCYSARKPDPRLYKPIPRTFRPLTDPSWGSDLQAELEASAFSAAKRTALLLPREAGGGGISLREMTEGALPSQPDTS